MMISTTLQETIKSILLKEWDPIGINEFDEANDEYDAYVVPLCHMVAEKKSTVEFYTFLRSVIESMGLDGDEQAEQAIAEKLASLSVDVG
ncbi:hypothetical protein ACIPMZ_01965 [Scandinavium goeteborgense]|uniref:hypothetical protein n=1 Tax=Scandinavium goeteborgense TaxID=1851514 RepID=UPI0038015F8E